MSRARQTPDSRDLRGPGKQSGYPEPQPDDADEARHGGKQPKPDREDGGLQRDADGDSCGGGALGK